MGTAVGQYQARELVDQAMYSVSQVSTMGLPRHYFKKEAKLRISFGCMF